MNEKLNNALTEFLQLTLQGVQNATEFAVTQLPDALQQLLLWKAVNSAIICLLFCIFIGIGLYYSKLRRKSLTPEDEERVKFLKEMGYSKRTIAQDSELHRLNQLYIIDDNSIWFIRVLTVIGIVFLPTTFTWLKILIAPKLYILEYIMRICA